MKRLVKALLVVLAAAWIGGCATTYRPTLEVAENCLTREDGKLADPSVAARCGANFAERATAPGEYAYTLYFAEFDDHGWPSPATPRGQWENQVDGVIEQVKKKMTSNRAEGDCVSAVTDGRPTVNLVVYVHGWQHNAAHDDDDVAEFRRLLREVAQIECLGRRQREVVGLYIGWRAKVPAVDYLSAANFVSFWTRKNAAGDIATGHVRELFARLDAVADRQNTAAREAKQAKPIRMLLIGHSFGAHILLTSLGGSVLKNIAGTLDAPQAPDCSATLPRDADMIVLVNPAIEATRYSALFSAARKWESPCYFPPLLVTAASEGDWATKSLFPIGRWVSTLFETYPSGTEQMMADKVTYANHDRFVTHRLHEQGATLNTSAVPYPRHAECANWEQAPIGKRIESEWKNACEFVHAHRASTPAAREFCSGVVLERIAPWRAPVMNVTVSKALMGGHSDLYRKPFVSFLRELYMDNLVDSAGIATSCALRGRPKPYEPK